MHGRARTWAQATSLVVLGCGESENSRLASALDWQACLDGAECATLEVPNDHADAGGPKREMALARVRASNGRVGALLFNLGGPGVASVDVVPGLASWFSQNAPEVRARFDLVGFDARGIGESTPAVDCIADSTMERIRALPLSLTSAADRVEHDLAGDEVLESCGRLDAEVMSRLDTESVARDLDILREALGETTLSYFGGSYGTQLGAAYATLFPERVRAFVLDSPVTPGWDRREILVGQAAGYDAALEAFFSWCAENDRCAFGPATDAAEVAMAFDDLVTSAEQSPLPAGDRSLSAFDLLAAVGSALSVGSDYWLTLAGMLERALDGDASSLRIGADLYYEREADGSYGEIVDAYMAIATLDAPLDLDRVAYDAFVESEVLPAGPRLGRVGAIGERLSIGWPFQRRDPPLAIHAPTAAPMLILSGRGDPATPLRWGEELRNALDNGSHFVTVDGWAHGQMFANSCARELTVRFLLEPAAVSEDSECL